MNSNSQNRIYLIGLFLILALPLLTTSLLFNPPAWGKTIVFRIILSILIFVFIYQILYKKIANKFSIVKNLLPFWLLIALWGIFLLATIFSLDPYYSFWESQYTQTIWIFFYSRDNWTCRWRNFKKRIWKIKEKTHKRRTI